MQQVAFYNKLFIRPITLTMTDQNGAIDLDSGGDPPNGQNNEGTGKPTENVNGVAHAVPGQMDGNGAEESKEPGNDVVQR